MKDAQKKISEDLAAEIAERFASPEIQSLLTDTKDASEAAAGTFEVVITTENLDRYQEVIKLDGWELEHYRKNPVVLWGHDHGKPIGVATSIEIADGKMIAKGKFAPTPLAQEIRALYDAGIIKATSVGFIEKEREGNLITKAELLEFSFVSVPANPYALSLSMERGLSIDELVTKGFMTVEKEAEEEPTVPEGETEEEAPTEEPAPTEEERSFNTKQVSPIVETLKSAIVALEALGTKAVEPEGDDEVAEEASEEELEAARFFVARKELQGVATLVGEALAEMRQVAEAQR